MKLLVVDDSTIMRRAIQKYSSSLPLRIIGTASNGAEALEMLVVHEPDVITLDITMPKIDGLSALKRIMEIAPRTRVLVITALSDTATGIQALRSGARGFLNKPFTEAQLVEELRHVCGIDDL
ncbi:MAG: response regulator [Spirochaetales bacterium]|nr:response regulator [Spirochaetales bacterium]